MAIGISSEGFVTVFFKAILWGLKSKMLFFTHFAFNCSKTLRF